MLRCSAILLLGLLCLPATPVSGQVFWSFRDTDAALQGVLSASTFMAGGRLGDLSAGGPAELRLGRDVAAPSASDQFIWPPCEPVPFSVVFDRGLQRVTYTLGGRVLQHATTFQDIDSIFIRGVALQDSSRIVFSGMTLDGIPVPNHYVRGPQGLRYLQLWGYSVQDGFTLAGLVKLCWGSRPPAADELDFRIMATKMAIVPAAEASWGGVKALYR